VIARTNPLLAAAACALLGGCVLLPVLGGPPPRDDDASPALALEGFEDVRGLVHVHSVQSHDSSGTFEAIADAAAETSAAFVVLCDHLRGGPAADDGPDGRVHDVLFVPGAELNRNGGSLLVLGIRKGVDPRVGDAPLVGAIRERGGLAGVGHPESIRLEGLVDADACELLNIHACAVEEGRFALFFRSFFLPPRPFFSSFVSRLPGAAAVYDALARTRPLAALGSCDAHEAIRPLGPLAGAVDSYRRLFRAATTHVWVPAARAGPSLSKGDVLDAIREGRTYAASELTQDATGFRFVARGSSGAVRALPGGSVPLAAGDALEVAVPVPADITILRDGAVTLVARDARAARWIPLAAGAYRVEATFEGRPWIFSSAIRVTGENETLPGK
jgi:hypothetical protein